MTTTALPTPAADVSLSASPIPYLRRLRVTADADEVVITGTVPSYYLKQLAQESVRGAVGLRKLKNRVEVGR